MTFIEPNSIKANSADASLCQERVGRFSLMSVLQNGFRDGSVIGSSFYGNSSESIAREIVLKAPEVQAELSDLVSQDVEGHSPLFRVFSQPWSYRCRAFELQAAYVDEMQAALEKLRDLGFLEFKREQAIVAGAMDLISVYYYDSYDLTEKGREVVFGSQQQDSPLNTGTGLSNASV